MEWKGRSSKLFWRNFLSGGDVSSGAGDDLYEWRYAGDGIVGE